MLLHATDGWAVIPNWIIYTVTTNIYGLRTDPQTGAPGLGIASSTNICSRKYVVCFRHILRILDKNSLNSDLSFFIYLYSTSVKKSLVLQNPSLSLASVFQSSTWAPCQEVHILARSHLPMHVKISYSVFLMACNRGLDLNAIIQDILYPSILK